MKLKDSYDIKSQFVGPCDEGVSEGKVLNRTIRWSDAGWELEADPRHSELNADQLGLSDGKGLSAPGADDDDKNTEEDQQLLEGTDITLFRGIAARGNYLALDRPDIQFASKEICREMSLPTRGSLRRLRHLGRYLVSHPRVVWRFGYQRWPDGLEVNVDSNWAGCRRTRKSTSGGTARWGQHTLKSWPKTQSLVAKSSAEAELYGTIRGSCEGLGLQSLFRDFGIDQTCVRVFLDASAAK